MSNKKQRKAMRKGISAASKMQFNRLEEKIVHCYAMGEGHVFAIKFNQWTNQTGKVTKTEGHRLVSKGAPYVEIRKTAHISGGRFDVFSARGKKLLRYSDCFMFPKDWQGYIPSRKQAEMVVREGIATPEKRAKLYRSFPLV